MDENIKNTCPNCCQDYNLKSLASEQKSHIPLFLKCGHSICECCVRNILNFGEPIECKICLQTMEIKTADIAELLQNEIQLYQLFPVNITSLGELALNLIVEKLKTKNSKAQDFFIDLQAILDSSNQNQGQCLECHSDTTKMCQQCATVICEDCFNKSHKNFVVFKNHVLQNIELQTTVNNCKVHTMKSLEYYCKDCAKPICMDCFMVGSEKSCKNHEVVSTLEMNKQFLSDLHEIFPQVDITFRRLTKTAVDIGHLLKNMENDNVSPELQHVTATINQHFSKLYAAVQAHKQEVMNNVARLRKIEQESLLKAKECVASSLKEAKQVMAALQSAMDPENNKSSNLSVLLEEAKNIVKKPWSLSKDESNKDSLKVCVSEEICLLVSDYVQMAGNAQARYALRATHELETVPPPPQAPVFPPTLQNGTDARFYKPKVDKAIPVASEEKPDQPKMDEADVPILPKDNPRNSSPELSKGGPKKAQKRIQFADKIPLIELKEGAQELLHITHMKDPHDFYVRRACDESLLTQLEEQLSGSLGDVPREVAKGELYAVSYQNSWKRGFIVAVDDETNYRVTCVDYGYTVTAHADRLREIPAALSLGDQSRYPAPLALRCRLSNCRPIAGAWRPDDTDLMRRMVDKSQVLLHVRRSGVVNECDVTTCDGVCVAHALCFHARATLLDPLLPYPEVPGEAAPALHPAHAHLRLRRVGDVTITHILAPGKFYVRECSLETDYVNLCVELNDAYDAHNESGYIYLPKTGTVCVVRLVAEQQCEYGGWARAVVTSAVNSEVCGVWLPDSGRQLTVPWHRLRAIEPRFTALKALAIESYLAGLCPLGGHWRAEASSLLARLVGRELRAVVCDEQHRSLGLVLLDLADNLCVNQYMVDSHYAVATGPLDFQLLAAEHNSPKREPNSQPPVTAEDVILDTSNGTTMAFNDQGDRHARGKTSIRLEAKILHYESPSLIYISLVHQQKTFNELFEDIQKFYMKRKTPRRENWKVNERCCALCIQSETWRRAVILNVERDKVNVFFTDFAQTESVPISHLKKLHSDFEVIGDAAIKCHLAGIVPAAEEWPLLTNAFLKDKLDEYKRVFVTKVGQFVETSMPVEVWVYHTEQGSALEPDESEWRCLNAELVARGLALPAPHCLQDEERGEPDDETLSFLNVRGSVHSWLLPMPPLPGPGSGSGSASGTGSSSDGRHPDDLFLTQWVPPEPLRATEFTAVPTYIDNDGIIYLHDVSQQDDLDFIRDTLQLAFKEPDPRAPFCSWRVGEPCVAKYYLDDHYYRGTVLAVHAEQSNCTVQYVDYGNSELCTFADLRKRVALHQIPIQAHKCILSRIKPTTGQWELDVLDYVHKAIVEKKCFIKVTGPAVDGVTPIDLKYDKLWFNDHLVEFGLAAYIDGFKPPERKFTPKKGTTSTPKNTREVKAVKDTVVKVDCSSEPDYIVEEDIDSSQASGSPDSFKIRTLVDVNSHKAIDPKHVTADVLSYPQHEEQEFNCNIPVINDTDSLELSIIRDPEFNSIYEELFETVKEEGGNMPALNGVFEYKPCIALFEGTWYRASILKYSEAKNLVKVHYVDYGNIGIVPLSDTREINKDWVRYPPICVTAHPHGVKVNPNLVPDDVTKAYIDTFLDKGPFRAKIVDYDNSVPLVELRNREDKLVYQQLIEDKVFLKDCDNSTSN